MFFEIIEKIFAPVFDEDGTWYTYGLDLTKNVCEVFGATGNVTQPIQWSSEFNDEELGLVYYNWRYYSSAIGNSADNGILAYRC